MTHVFSGMLVWLFITVVVLPCMSPTAAQDTNQAALFGPEEIEQMVAPIALYPDALLAQILMASTYPLEVVQAERWAQANPNLQDQALEDALQNQPWDPSVKSLTAFPQVLTMMNQKLDLTQKLGDAVLAQQGDVMDAIQRLRAKAQTQGTLQTTKEQTVIVEQPAASQTTVIRIEPADPQVVYVPTYNPTVVYGAWPYPTYPPYAYYPPGYTAATSLLSFGVGMAVGSALWGDFDWNDRDVDINVNRYNSFNRTNISNAKWDHNVAHRKGVQYRDAASQQKYNRTAHTGGDAREAFRGRAESGRQQLARGSAQGGQQERQRGGAKDLRHDTPKGHTGAKQVQDRQQAKAHRERPEASRTADRKIGQEPREARTQTRPATDRRREAGAFEGVGNGREVRRDSDRGRASRQSAAASRASFQGGGGGRGGGHEARQHRGGGHSGGGRGGGRGGGHRGR